MFRLRTSRAEDVARLIEIWRKAVDATHHFLSQADRIAIEQEVSAFLPQVELTLAVDATDRPIGFMFLHEGHMEALFIEPDHHGKGVGKALVRCALQLHSRLTTDVNEQNEQAMAFYERIGFERIGRSALDGQGRLYPLIHLRFRSAA
ncbi:acetyltransferase [Brucella endophytica]|uniref:Acetyltransferase n=1 Tax=Brucella endophytica TaxID=1963359 RepID=A0A916WEV2_9HYPH|nr:acetyltransferase [Brucella endophytica]GGA91274.1 acetyltransferase [Brucella endophytica]